MLFVRGGLVNIQIQALSDIIELMRTEARGEATELVADSAGTDSHVARSLHPLLSGACAVLFDAGGTLSHPDWEGSRSLRSERQGATSLQRR